MPLERTGVPSSFRLTWTAAEIQQETERPGPRCAMWTWGVEEGRKKKREGSGRGEGIYTLAVTDARKERSEVNDEFCSVD